MEISNTQDIIDSRDIIKRIVKLEEKIDEIIEEKGYDEFDVEVDEIDDAEYWELKEELDVLLNVQDQCEGYSDWGYGETLIHEDYFVEYCEDMLKDIGDLPQDIPWYIEIDWEATVENIKQDYTEVDFGDEVYFMRMS